MMRRRVLLRWAILGLAAPMLAVSLGCGKAVGSSSSGGKPRIVCTVGMVADVVRNVVGDRARVENLIGEGVDPHLYKPTRNDVIALQSADVVFYNGLLLEGKMTDVFVQLATGGRPVFPVTAGLGPDAVIEPAELHGHADPHVWMDAGLWSKSVDVVAEALSGRDPDGAAQYRANAAAYKAELAKLDDYVRRVIASIPEKQRVLITAHDAFRYFGKAYGIEVLGIQGISTESEAGLEDIKRLVDRIVHDRIGAVFVETSVADKNVRALIEGAKARGHAVSIGGSLFSDAMGAPGTYEGTYIGMIDHNATLIARALGGDAPPGGMQGKLAKESK